MIEDVFGGPSLPNVIRDCYLFFKNGEHFFLEEIYIFDKYIFVEVMKFGEVSLNALVFNGKRIAGYFSTFDSNIDELKDPSRIIGKDLTGITCIIEPISFTKFNHQFTTDPLHGYCANIRFEANELKYKYNR